MIKKILLSLAMFGFVFGSPILANAQSFTNLKAQLFDLSDKLENFKKVESKGEVLGVTSSYDISFTASPVQIKPGELVTLTWKTDGAISCNGTSSPNLPIWNSISSKSLVTGFFLYQTQTFNLSCIWPEGVVKTASVTVIVVDKFFKANPTKVPYLGSTKLDWNMTNTWQIVGSGQKDCRASGDWAGEKVLKGSQLISGIKTDKIFNLECVDVLTGATIQGVVKVEVINPNDKDKAEVVSIPDDTKITTTTDSNTCSFTFKKALAYGSKDSKSARDVALMQSVLVDEGLLSSKDATGVFYAKTQTALKNFQKRYNLSQTGKLDTKTADKMNTLFAQYCAN